MPHGHGPAGENPDEIHIFANSILRHGQPLARITAQGQANNNEIWATYKSDVPITKAELNYSVDTGRWQDRKWETVAAEIDVATGRVFAQIPAEAKAYYLNLFDDRNCAVSTQHIVR